MKLPRRRFLHLAAGVAALAVLSRVARAQSYPTRPVRVVVGFAAGGAFDIAARTMGQWLSDRLGQPFIIENRPGGSTNIATEAVVRAPPDGYTLLLGGGTNAINATLYEKLKFDFIKDTTPVAGIIQFPNVIAVIPSFPVKTIPDRTEEYAPRNHREAQQRDQCGARRPQDEGTVCRSGRHGAARPARRFREAHRGRNREVGEGGQVRRPQGGVGRSIAGRHSLNSVSNPLQPMSALGQKRKNSI